MKPLTGGDRDSKHDYIKKDVDPNTLLKYTLFIQIITFHIVTTSPPEEEQFTKYCFEQLSTQNLKRKYHLLMQTNVTSPLRIHKEKWHHLSKRRKKRAHWESITLG